MAVNSLNPYQTQNKTISVNPKANTPKPQKEPTQQELKQMDGGDPNTSYKFSQFSEYTRQGENIDLNSYLENNRQLFVKQFARTKISDVKSVLNNSEYDMSSYLQDKINIHNQDNMYGKLHTKLTLKDFNNKEIEQLPFYETDDEGDIDASLVNAVKKNIIYQKENVSELQDDLDAVEKEEYSRITNDGVKSDELDGLAQSQANLLTNNSQLDKYKFTSINNNGSGIYKDLFYNFYGGESIENKILEMQGESTERDRIDFYDAKVDNVAKMLKIQRDIITNPKSAKDLKYKDFLSHKGIGINEKTKLLVSNINKGVETDINALKSPLNAYGEFLGGGRGGEGGEGGDENNLSKIISGSWIKSVRLDKDGYIYCVFGNKEYKFGGGQNPKDTFRRINSGIDYWYLFKHGRNLHTGKGDDVTQPII